ncbi:ATP-binding protein [Phenylobacterium sp.]|uniref:ATP-binding protein n=1 Tax=Phenylobacterium sp. TaxID=1871053 RepID=UPI002735E305|nr:ATP-binding protein [Phenylobacterium sp.]MDP3659964.1 ATP-binding protein [Phenylobacterium sp.]
MPSPQTPPPHIRPVLVAGGAGLAGLAALTITGAAPTGVGLALMLIAGVATALGVAAARRDATPPALTGPAPLVGVTAQSPYGVIADMLPDPVLVVVAEERDDLTGRRFVYANAAARDLLRLQKSEGVLVTVLRRPEVLEAVDAALFDAREAEAMYETGVVQNRIFRVLARSLGATPAGARLALMVFREETEMRRVERTRADFLANASHELRTPLASLAGFIETLRGHARTDEAARERFLGIMQAQAARMSRLIDDLMSLSRIELNEHNAPCETTDLTLAVGDVLDALAPLADERGVRFERALPAVGAALGVGDRDQIIQVLQNLAHNAIKYSVDGGQVRVSVETGVPADALMAGGESSARFPLLLPDPGPRTFVAVRISDDGPGIAREHLPRLTERFYRIEGQKSGERSGSGLGLAIVKHIINRHRGGLTVESRTGKGAAFTAYFPMAEGAVPSAATGLATKVS